MGTAPDTIPLDLTKTVLSQCPEFIAWTGAADATAALAFIYLHETPDKPVFPLAVIGFGQTRNSTRIATGNAFEANGSVKISFQSPFIVGQTEGQALAAIHNTLSIIMDREFFAQAVNVGFNISGIERQEYPQLIAEKDRDDRGFAADGSYEVLYVD